MKSALKNVTIGIGACIHISKAYARVVSFGLISLIVLWGFVNRYVKQKRQRCAVFLILSGKREFNLCSPIILSAKIGVSANLISRLFEAKMHLNFIVLVCFCLCCNFPIYLAPSSFEIRPSVHYHPCLISPKGFHESLKTQRRLSRHHLLP